MRGVNKRKYMVKTNNSKASRGKNKRAGNETKLTAEQSRVALASELKITEKTKNYYDELIDNPKTKQIDAYIKTHEPKSIESAHVQASRLIHSDKYQIYKASAVGKAKRRIVSLVDSGNESIALKASQDIVDRTEGKAKQLDGDKTTVVRVELDLTGVKLGNHYIAP